MLNLTNCVYKMYLLFIIGLLIGCQPDSVGQIDVEATNTVFPVTRTPFPPNPPTYEPTPTVLTHTPQTITQTIEVVTSTVEVIIPTESPTPSPWQIDLSNNFFVYMYPNGQNTQISYIYLYEPDKDSKQLLGEGDFLSGDGEGLSPDGMKLVFDPDGYRCRFRKCSNQLTLANLMTGEIKLIHLLKRPFKIFWSPDSSVFYYVVKLEDGQRQIISYDIYTEQNTSIFEFEADPSETWINGGVSPDGQFMVFIMEENEQYDVYLLNLMTLEFDQITNTPEIEVDVLWSPVADTLLIRQAATTIDYEAFNHPPYNSDMLILFDIVTNKHIFLEESFAVLDVIWSQDGRQLAYINSGRLCTMNISISEQHCFLMETTFYDEYVITNLSNFAWSADNKWLNFIAGSKQRACDKLFLLNLESDVFIDMNPHVCYGSHVYWSKFVNSSP